MSPQSLPPAGPPQAHRTISYKHSPRCPPKVCPLLAHLRHTGSSPINTHPDVPPKSAPCWPTSGTQDHLLYTLTQMSPQSLPPAGPPQAHRTVSYKHSPRCPPKVCPLLAHLRHTGPSPINTHPDVPPKSAPCWPTSGTQDRLL